MPIVGKRSVCEARENPRSDRVADSIVGATIAKRRQSTVKQGAIAGERVPAQAFPPPPPQSEGERTGPTGGNPAVKVVTV